MSTRQVPLYYYSSASGMVRLFAERVCADSGRQALDLGERAVRRSVPDGPWVLITPSYKTGNPDNDTIPEAVRRFLADPVTRRRLAGVIGSGNRNFGRHYQAAARQIAAASGRPMLLEVELQGTRWDVEDARRLLGELDATLAQRVVADPDPAGQRRAGHQDHEGHEPSPDRSSGAHPPAGAAHPG
ncbi:class Ib ribonucleoside-diphosphate reductase assembly flavoprotein NrdI [Xylanimonas ulmi]|uniref:Protein involved in ribonucleotide reduction n=1 Tax=Xylanimonas ulmi TaxID=228973 RepID=A0A4Q7M5N1_9MICO|nr:class Ib ribonucleoside-diphosphate reductase assembly flavoprotein NrdI [Xylanibacterium ulmi]RZS62353.1 protein involved in ribonucleotide reduction [Xylanibacterium ulmi]